ncbi:hypothetical protein BKA67DRAFT_563188 [Truncatella angustata]|uniref:Uncharacterized protein n=1 Tax=Truncatella angustata TaxID=152316 RepID=A0A9P8UKI9_9PEZI|nr:uncharacterized protein BKA67DRAFT_563188 [Truncatella angustata]KAH6653799.1 hypothetical protein BKA67DRAFT_563188 [Truncatella angustata]
MTLTELGSLVELKLQVVHVACLQNDIEALGQILLEHKTIEAKTAQGETPLHLSTLMGHIEAVQLLLEKGADTVVLDSFRKTPPAYSHRSVFNDARRQIYAKHGFPESRHINLSYNVIATLHANTTPSYPHSTGDASGPLYFHITSKGAEVFQSLGRITTRSFNPCKKTVGYIRTARDLRPLAWTISGFGDLDAAETSKLLQGKKWKDAVLNHVAPAICYTFKSHVMDRCFVRGILPPEMSGQFFASHVECKLAVWFCFALLAAMGSIPNPSFPFLAQKLDLLADADIGTKRQAVIEINLPPCESCVRFLQALSRVTRIHFNTKYRRSLVMIPERDVQRSFKLAHEVDMAKHTEPDLALDADWRWGQGDDHERIEPEIFTNGEGEENILGGMEGFDVQVSRGLVRESTMWGADSRKGKELAAGADDDSDNESLSTLSEDYRDEAADKNFHGRLAYLSHDGSRINKKHADLDDPFMDQDIDLVVSNVPMTPTVISRTQIQLKPGIPATPVVDIVPNKSCGTVEDPVRIPQSPLRERWSAPRPSWTGSPYSCVTTVICLNGSSSTISWIKPALFRFYLFYSIYQLSFQFHGFSSGLALGIAQWF